MNDKLVRRAARMYREWLKDRKESPAIAHRSMILSKLSNAVSKVNEAEAWAIRFLDGMTPRVQVEVGTELDTPPEKHVGILNTGVYENLTKQMIPNLSNSAILNLQQAVSVLQSISNKEVPTPLSPTEAIEEIKIINESWPTVSFRNGELCVTIKRVSLSDDCETVDLGDFTMKLNLRSPVCGLSIESVDNIQCSNGYCHPHVEEESLCTGDAGDLMADALEQGRLEDYFRIVEATLRTYNESSPHSELASWYDPDHSGKSFCDYCEEWRDEDTSYYCESCNATRCEGCSEGGGVCTECRESQCGNCSSECGGCCETVCDGCQSNCSGCSDVFCSSCTSECLGCQSYYCESCMNSCANCSNNRCDSCIKNCADCGDAHCEDCVDNKCENCNDEICDCCIEECSQCEQCLCTSCHKNTCEHCGVPMCENCEEEHSCLLEGVSK